MNKSVINRKKNQIIKTTKNSMESLGTYRKEFDVIIERYAEMRVQFDMLNEKWYEKDCVITESYTNKAGATNERKSPLYMAVEKMRTELTSMEDRFGMTPKGLKGIKRKGLEQKKESALDKMLSG